MLLYNCNKDIGIKRNEVIKMIKKDWLLEASVDGSSVDYSQTYMVENETGDPSYEDMVEAQTIAEKHGCEEYTLLELD